MSAKQLSLTLPSEHPSGGVWEWPTKYGAWVCRAYPRGNSRPGVARHTTWAAAMVRALALLDASPGFYEAVEVKRFD